MVADVGDEIIDNIPLKKRKHHDITAVTEKVCTKSDELDDDYGDTAQYSKVIREIQTTHMDDSAAFTKYIN